MYIKIVMNGKKNVGKEKNPMQMHRVLTSQFAKSALAFSGSF
jgi:hypothetical protein